MFKSGSVLFSVIGWIGGGLSTIFWGTLSVLASLFPKAHKFQHFCMRIWSRWCCWCSRTKVTVYGSENASMDQPQIYAANHQAIHDILILGGWIPTSYRWIVRKEWFRTPFIGWHLAHSGNIAIDRSNPRKSAESLREAVKIILANNNVLFFPEGTRHHDAVMQEFKPGGFVLAQRAGVPILPVTIVGTKNIVRKNSWRVYRGEIKLYIGKPIDTSKYGKHDREKLIHDVEDAVAENLPPESRVDYETRKAARAEQAEVASP